MIQMVHLLCDRCVFREPRLTMIQSIGSRSVIEPALAGYGMQIARTHWCFAGRKLEVRGIAY
jgi:hypothetical protein